MLLRISSFFFKPSAPVAPVNRAMNPAPNAPVVVAVAPTCKIHGHQFINRRPSLYKIAGTNQLVTEKDMGDALFQDLMDYKAQISGRQWDGVAGYFDVEKILGHRWVEGTLYYWVSWADEWSHPIWNSEVAAEDMGEELIEEYNRWILINANPQLPFSPYLSLFF